jgi:hypothetical protein
LGATFLQAKFAWDVGVRISFSNVGRNSVFGGAANTEVATAKIISMHPLMSLSSHLAVLLLVLILNLLVGLALIKRAVINYVTT